ncbi:DUF1116 domain-containing protein [Bradyrhizobium sp. NP1]|uniref:oxamate carbamoyltransferase subunit AllG family protein n=1 Tax=Bradyrhizobium sp. NP1 TaxID=3049772 RepID=UPI0025A5D4C2|nr:DUF1116 domain-containing protein [Bradyrhizobium sp. NP1]WJR80380.1 DUF1116 domain-containing protein [Bradyrhizobium sp. NP1]
MTDTHARLRRLVRLHDARPDLSIRTLFHAGPPYRGTPPKAVTNAAAQAAVVSGLAETAEQARRMIERSELDLLPAQDHGIAVPLGMVLSAQMWCFEVGDDTRVFHSPVGEGPPPALRFGSDDPACATRARDWCAEAAGAINPLLANGLAVEPLMSAALQQGDECHAITAAGNRLFIEQLGPLPAEIKAAISGNAGFVLGVWMAWAGWKLQTSQAMIAAIGGNGREFGWRPRDQAAWRTMPAPPPTGKYFQPDRAAHALGAVGDSAIVDICGFGGQALHCAPALMQEWADVLPSDLKQRRDRIVDSHSGIVDIARIRDSRIEPIINLAILDRDGAAAPLGRGVVIVPPTLFSTGD